MNAVVEPLRNGMRRMLLLMIRVYQRTLSPDTGALRILGITGRTCRFSPTCSHYAYGAIERYGIMTGLFLALKRIVRCHPGNPGGYDPVPDHL